MNSQVAAGKYQGERPELPIEAFETTSWLQCIKTQGGAWAIVLTSAVLMPSDDWDPAKLELQVRARFGPEDCDAMMAGRPQKPNASPYFELMLSACKTDVPFTLP